MEELDHTLPIIGTKYRYISDNGQAILYTSSFSYDPENKIVFSETDEKSKTATYYVIEKINEHRSRLTIEFYLQKNFVAQTLFKIAMKRKMEAVYQRSLQNLDPLLKVIPVPEF